MNINVDKRRNNTNSSQVCLFTSDSSDIASFQNSFKEQAFTLLDSNNIKLFFDNPDRFEYVVIDEDLLPALKSDLFPIFSTGIKTIIFADKENIQCLSKIPGVRGFLLKNRDFVDVCTFISNNDFYKGPLNEKYIDLIGKTIKGKEVLRAMLVDVFAQTLISLKNNLHLLSEAEINNRLTRLLNNQTGESNDEYAQILSEIGEDLLYSTSSISKTLKRERIQEHPGLILNQLLIEYQKKYTCIHYCSNFYGDNFLGKRVKSDIYSLFNCILDYLSNLKSNNSIQIDMSYFKEVLSFEFIAEGHNNFDGLNCVIAELFDSMHLHCMLVDNNYFMSWSKAGDDKFSIKIDFSTDIYC